VIHVHSPLPAAIARLAALTLRRTSRPSIVSTEHNRWETFHPLTQFLNTVTSRLDTVTLAVSDEVAESLTGPARRRVQVLRHGIDVHAVAQVRSNRADVRTELGIAPNEFVVGTVANFRPQKDYPNLLAAAKHLMDAGLPIRFVAVGQGPGENEVRRLHRELELGSQFVFTGFRDDAVRVMAACDVFVLASKWEGLPVAVMEACALGLPIVATNVGGLAEEFVNEDTALLVPAHNSTALANELQRIYDDRVLRALLATAATASSVRFDVGRVQQQLEDIYMRVGRSLPQKATASASTRSSARPKASRPEVIIRRATSDDRGRILDLCRVGLGWSDDPRFAELFAWKHDANPFGPSLLLVAEHGGRIVGLRAFMCWEFVRGGKVLRAVRAVDTVTHPDSRGLGLFTATTLEGLRNLDVEGVDFVFNTPNDQSRPGYLKMGWREVGTVPIAVRVVRPDGLGRLLTARTAASHWPEDVITGSAVAESMNELLAAAERDRHIREPVDNVRAISTHSTDDFLRWRYGSTLTGTRLVTHGDGAVIVTARRRGQALECSVLDSFALNPVDADRAAVGAARDMGADFVIRTGRPSVSGGFVPAPGFGPRLVWRSVRANACPPLANWQIPLGTIASF
jgi:hypothetical protein